MNRVSDNSDTGIGKIKYDKVTEKFKKYQNTECI